MISRLQFARSVNALSLFRRRMLAPLYILALLGCASLSHAREGPPGTVGRVEGSDVSVEGGTAATLGTSTAAPSMFVANGDVVTVHSGQARMTLTAGGRLDICGPAKLTVLEASGDITIALNFGRVHIELPAATSLRIFTPSIIATPVDIGGAQRDVAVGLNLDDSLCVLATSGALQLEHQFTGEKLIVPQLGEFFLSGGQMVPVAGAPGSCECAEMQTRTSVSPSPLSLSQPAPSDVMLTVPPATTSAAPAAEPPANQPPAPEPSISYSVLGHANESRPLASAPKNSVPPAPVVTIPTYTAVAPLSYSAGDPLPPPDPSPDMVLLIRTAHVNPDWEFSGRVEAPGFAESMQRALGESPAPPPQSQAPAINQLPAKQKKGGFWSGLKRIFAGSGP